MNKLSDGPGNHNHGRIKLVSGTLLTFILNLTEKLGGNSTSLGLTFSNTSPSIIMLLTNFKNIINILDTCLLKM